MKTITIVYGGDANGRLDFLRPRNPEGPYVDIYKDSIEKVKRLVKDNSYLSVDGGGDITLVDFYVDLYKDLKANIFVWSLEGKNAVLRAVRTSDPETLQTAIFEFTMSSKRLILEIKQGVEPAEMFIYMPYEIIVEMCTRWLTNPEGLKSSNLLKTKYTNIQVLPGHSDNIILDAYDPQKTQRFTFELIIRKG